MSARPIAIAVFARAPVPGAAKTRLIPRLGAAGAARLQAQLTELAVARALAVAPNDSGVWWAGDPMVNPSLGAVQFTRNAETTSASAWRVHSKACCRNTKTYC